jgi:hypothetical protein
MAFKLLKKDDSRAIPQVEYYLLTDGEASVEGEAMVQTSGRLTKCGATTTPQFIAMKTQALEAASVTPIPVHRVKEDDVFEVNSMATVAASLIGNKVTLHTDGLLITATTSSGVAEIGTTDGVTTTSKCTVRFRNS